MDYSVYKGNNLQKWHVEKKYLFNYSPLPTEGAPAYFTCQEPPYTRATSQFEVSVLLASLT